MTTKFLEQILDQNYEFKRTLDIKHKANKINNHDDGDGEKKIERKKSNLENDLNYELYDDDADNEEFNEEYLVFQE